MLLSILLLAILINCISSCDLNYTLSTQSSNYNQNNNYWYFHLPLTYPETKNLCFIYQKQNSQSQQKQFLRMDFLPKCLDYKNDNFELWKQDSKQKIWKVSVSMSCSKLYRKINETDIQPFIVQLKQNFTIGGFNLDANIVYKYLPVVMVNSIIIMLLACYYILKQQNQYSPIQNKKQN